MIYFTNIAAAIWCITLAGCLSPVQVLPDNNQQALTNQKVNPQAIKIAARHILTRDCEVISPDQGDNPDSVYKQILKEAGAEIVPVLTEMILDKDLSVWFVSTAASLSADYPFSEEFRNSLRLRRDDPDFNHDHGAKLKVFDFFATYGDDSDLVWMEKSAGSLDKERRRYADKPLAKLRSRLGKPL